MACLTPIRIRGKKKLPEGGYIVSGFNMVPCGKCVKCLLRRVNDWVIRLQHEDRHFGGGGLFVTLTYDKENCPLSPKGLKTTSKHDIQKFFKRLRKKTGKKIKYYVAAEYGSQTYRPHYHAIIFGATRSEVDTAWGLGSIHIGNVTSDSIAYSLKYISKDKLIPQFLGDDRQREFSLSSTNLGKSYLSDQMVKYHKNNLASYYTKEGGYLAPLPRYYRDRIFTETEKKLIFEGQQQKNLEKYNALVSYYGSHHEYYRIMGEYAREQKRLQKLKNFEHDKL